MSMKEESFMPLCRDEHCVVYPQKRSRMNGYVAVKVPYGELGSRKDILMCAVSRTRGLEIA